MFAPVIGAAYTMTTNREAHWSEQKKAYNTEGGSRPSRWNGCTPLALSAEAIWTAPGL